MVGASPTLSILSHPIMRNQEHGVGAIRFRMSLIPSLSLHRLSPGPFEFAFVAGKSSNGSPTYQRKQDYPEQYSHKSNDRQGPRTA